MRPSDDGFGDDEVVSASTAYLELWQAENFGGMAELLSPRDRPAHKEQDSGDASRRPQAPEPDRLHSPELSGQSSPGANGVLSEDGVVPPHIRLAELSDVPDITECYLRSWRAAYAADLEPEALVVEAEKRRSFDWARGIGEDSTGVFVASDHRGLLGVVQSNLSLPPPRNLPEITMLYVDPRAWGTGAADALLEAGTDWIRQKDHAAARLRVVESHQRARHFYEREGWILDDGIAPAANDLFRLIYYTRTLTS